MHLPWKALLTTVHLPWKRSTIGEVEDLVGVQQLAEAGDQLQALHHHNPDYARAKIFTILRSPGIDSKESIPPFYVAKRATTITIFLLGS
jgi:hypothetical protein